jgi:uncharacterized protein YeaO (DUF488 family)
MTKPERMEVLKRLLDAGIPETEPAFSQWAVQVDAALQYEGHHNRWEYLSLEYKKELASGSERHTALLMQALIEQELVFVKDSRHPPFLSATFWLVSIWIIIRLMGLYFRAHPPQPPAAQPAPPPASATPHAQG